MTTVRLHQRSGGLNTRSTGVSEQPMTAHKLVNVQLSRVFGGGVAGGRVLRTSEPRRKGARPGVNCSRENVEIERCGRASSGKAEAQTKHF